jgi:hypothetical protein
MLHHQTGRSANVKLAVLDAACPVFLDPQEFLAKTANPVFPVPLVLLVSLAAHHQSAKNHHHPHADHAHLDPQDLKDLPVPLEAVADLETLAVPATMVAPAPLDHKDLPANLAALVPMDNPEMLVAQLSAHQTPPATQASPEIQAHKDSQANQATLDKTDNPAAQDPRDPAVHPDLLVSLAATANLDLKAHLALRENVVFARNTALWTVEFSSKMEQDVKHQLLDDYDLSEFSRFSLFLPSCHVLYRAAFFVSYFFVSCRTVTSVPMS